MPQQLLLMSCEQAERSEPAVRAGAFLHIARVLARSDRDAAVGLLERGIRLAREQDNETASLLLANGVYLTAAVSPRHAIALYADQKASRSIHFRHDRSVVGMVNAMAQHGHIRDVLAYFEGPLPGDRFPLDFVGNLSRECRDDKTRLGLLSLAVREWKKGDWKNAHPGEGRPAQSFVFLFAHYWRLLPEEEARLLLREAIQWVREAPTEDYKFHLTNHPASPELTSNEHLLFLLLPAAQSLDPDLPASLFATCPQLDAAAKRWPKGMESVRDEEPEWKFDRARDDSMTVGQHSIMEMSEAIATDFKAAFREAGKEYAKDSNPENPNAAPKDAWPSAHEYRNILFKAGQHLGWAAEKYLDRIPDSDLRLFAQIELCAGVEDLPQIGYFSSFRPSKPQQRRVPSAAEIDDMWGPELSGICCPKCRWKPRAKCEWSCKCSHKWNTFETRGLCPGCAYQWELTGCLQCGAMSPHLEWYVEH